MLAPGSRRGLRRGESAPGGASGGLADDAGDEELAEQAERGLWGDRQRIG